MKKMIFTLSGLALMGITMTVSAQNPTSYGTGWETLQPGEPLVLEEDFRGFPFLHSDSNPNEGNSSNSADGSVMGYKDDSTSFVVATGSKDTIFYNFYQCAFGPNWISAYGYRDSVDNGTSTMPTQMSRGFIEISREWGDPHYTVDGSFTLDLRSLDFVEVVQFSHSSCGGSKRGFTLAMSTDDGVTWDTIRQHCSNYAYVTPGEPEVDYYNCDNSGYGMLWEHGIYDFNVMLRFTKDPFNQAVRLHDLKVYGDVAHPEGISDIREREIGIACINRVIRLSEVSDIGIYDLGGALLKRADMVETYAVKDLPEGLYIVRAKTGKKITTRKIMIR